METYKILETEFAEFAGMKYASAVNSGTSALHLALLALGIGPGDEVIVPDMTFVACAFAISYTGAKPIFIPSGIDLNMDVYALENLNITEKTKAIIAVHLFGRQCDIEYIKKFAERHNLKVIEDMSQAHGILPSTDIACYSFQQSKIIHCEEGGMLATNDIDILNKVNHLKNFAHNAERTYIHDQISFNYRMPNTIAGIALQSLREVGENLEKRKQVEKWFTEFLRHEYQNFPRNVLWVYDLHIPFGRDVVLKKLQEAGINARTIFKPLSSLPMYKDSSSTDTYTQHLSDTGIYIIINPNMTKEDVKTIVEVIHS